MPCRLLTKKFDASYASTLRRRESGANWLGPSSPTSTPGRRGCMRILVCSLSKRFEPHGLAADETALQIAPPRPGTRGTLTTLLQPPAAVRSRDASEWMSLKSWFRCVSSAWRSAYLRLTGLISQRASLSPFLEGWGEGRVLPPK